MHWLSWVSCISDAFVLVSTLVLSGSEQSNNLIALDAMVEFCWLVDRANESIRRSFLCKISCGIFSDDRFLRSSDASPIASEIEQEEEQEEEEEEEEEEDEDDKEVE